MQRNSYFLQSRSSANARQSVITQRGASAINVCRRSHRFSTAQCEVNWVIDGNKKNVLYTENVDKIAFAKWCKCHQCLPKIASTAQCEVDWFIDGNTENVDKIAFAKWNRARGHVHARVKDRDCEN